MVDLDPGLRREGEQQEIQGGTKLDSVVARSDLMWKDRNYSVIQGLILSDDERLLEIYSTFQKERRALSELYPGARYDDFVNQRIYQGPLCGLQ
jgi:hypothetical protein